MANIEKIVLPDNTEYNIKDANAVDSTTTRSITVSSTEPQNPQGGDIWIDRIGKVYKDNNWTGIYGYVPNIQVSQEGTITVSNWQSWNEICSTSNVVPGTYLAFGSYTFTGAGYDTQARAYIGIGASSGGWSKFNPSVRMATSSQYTLQVNVFAPYFISGESQNVKLWGLCQYNGAVISGGYMALIRLDER